jgi:hypothetical protein
MCMRVLCRRLISACLLAAVLQVTVGCGSSPTEPSKAPPANLPKNPNLKKAPADPPKLPTRERD